MRDERETPLPVDPVGQADGVAVVPMTETHWSAVEDIYGHGIATGHATFAGEPPSWREFDAAHLAGHRHVAVDDTGAVLGWVAVAPVSGRCVYAGVVEVSVYVHPAATGQGVGRTLLHALIASTEDAGIWAIQAGVFPENHASLALHRSVGFRDVGTLRGLGLMTHGPCAGQWRDVVLLERRSATVGV
jgi:L-amino acid N-acyltransferase YncA